MYRLKLVTILLVFTFTSFYWPGEFVSSDVTTASMPGQNLVCKTSGTARICASVSNSTPLQYSYVTVYGRLTVNGVRKNGKTMITTWHYKTSTPQCQGITASNGLANCKRYISGATKGYRVNIVVKINGYSVTTWFTPH